MGICPTLHVGPHPHCVQVVCDAVSVCCVQVVRAGELVASGTVGEPYHALANYWEAIGYNTFLDEAHFFAGGNWRFDPEKAGGGVLIDGATHWARPLTMW